MGTTRSRFLTGFAIPEAYFRCSESLRPWIFCNSRQGSWSSRQHDGALELPIPSDPNRARLSSSSCEGALTASTLGEDGALSAI